MRYHSNEHGFLDELSRLRIYRDKATHDKIHRHLTDINDTITEEDIRNIRILGVDWDIPATGTHEMNYTLPQAS